MPSRTPLVPAPRISAALGVDIQLKLETANPTHSFKDRMAASAVAAAQAFGIETLLLRVDRQPRSGGRRVLRRRRAGGSDPHPCGRG